MLRALDLMLAETRPTRPFTRIAITAFFGRVLRRAEGSEATHA
jgi:hypothetical protein